MTSFLAERVKVRPSDVTTTPVAVLLLKRTRLASVDVYTWMLVVDSIAQSRKLVCEDDLRCLGSTVVGLQAEPCNVPLFTSVAAGIPTLAIPSLAHVERGGAQLPQPACSGR